MDVSKIDKNFAAGEYREEGDTRFYGIPCAPFDLYGVYYEKETERFVRMPSLIADKVSEGVSLLNPNTAGGRIRFSTDSRYFSLKVTYGGLTELPHMPLTGSSGFVLLAETEKGLIHVANFFPFHLSAGESYKSGYSSSCSLCGKKTNYILFFPLYNDVKSLEIGLDGNATVSHGKKYKDVKPILYYGSSITQGGCASRPDNAYQSIISKWNNVDFINLGFSGNAKAETVMCEYLAGIDCSVFVCDYDHNAPDKEHLRKTHYPLYSAFRKTHPNTPIIFISRPDTEHDPCIKERFEIIKETYERAISDGDKNVRLIDGKTFFKGRDRNCCTVEGCHPNDIGFYKMAKVIYKQLCEMLKA